MSPQICKMKINLISLGCSKNLVDSEVILGSLGEKGCSFTTSLEDADIIIVNTCSFIKEARRESHNVISKIVSQKSPFQKLIVCGCLPQLERRKLFARYPQIDALLGSADFYKIDEIIGKILSGGKHLFSVNTPYFIYNSNFPRLLSTPPSYAYLKIAEGCSNRCSYCLIPYLRGDYRSRPIDDVVKEARALADLGVKELVLIAQDITFYGKDLEGKCLLPSLLEKLEEIDKIKWIRLLYTHPAHFNSTLIQAMVNLDKVCRYLDIPLQHSHNEILTRMRRPKFEVAERVIEKLREKIPNIALRTTLMVGFPGEEERHFNKLLKDVERIKFDWLGAFIYSPEKGTPAYSFSPKIPLKVKKRRYKELLELQQSVTLEKNKRRLGKVFPILVDADKEGHTEFQAPEIDGKVLLAERHRPGEFLRKRIFQVKDCYDLIVDEKVREAIH